MEQLPKLIKQLRLRTWLVALLMQLVVGWLGALLYFAHLIPDWAVVLVYALFSIGAAFITALVSSSSAKIPLEAFGQAIAHITPGDEKVGAPKFDSLSIGREYVTSLAYQLYQIASLQNNKDLAEHRKQATQATNIVSHFPLPLFVFNKQQQVTYCSDSALGYTAMESSQLFGKKLFEALELEFPTDFTLESWINDSQLHKATDTAYWHRVRLQLKDDANTLKQFDMAGYYNRDNPSGTEFIITLFDRTSDYAQDDKYLSFIALVVHELRTPLTNLRGYTEVLDDELAGKLDPELTIFMKRLQASAQQLASFVNNILNVVRVEENQLSVKLASENWSDIVNQVVKDMSIRAQANGRTLSVQMAASLPPVGADRVTIYEVLVNLIENAIKYSGASKEIVVKSYLTKDNLIETVVEDQGVGIPTAVLPNLFEKYHRNHRNRTQVSGTGLGLYLSKAIVNAHGGDIWVKSKEGEGTQVGFTIKPYSQVADETKSGQNDLVRTAHGWIKNHSLYRR